MHLLRAPSATKDPEAHSWVPYGSGYISNSNRRPPQVEHCGNFPIAGIRPVSRATKNPLSGPFRRLLYEAKTSVRNHRRALFGSTIRARLRI